MNVCFNGQFFPADQPLLAVQNSSYKWGDGLFETMKVRQGKLLLSDYHFERLFGGLHLLQMEKAVEISQLKMIPEILALCQQNNCEQSARVRLAVYRNESNKPGYTIEALPLDKAVNEWSPDGLSICIYPFARKAIDAFANLKSASFLPYVLAHRYAAEKSMDDAIVLNVQNFLCDTARANIFLVKENVVYTPALHQGCVNGVMRRMVMEIVKKSGLRLQQEEISEEQLLQADEVFLTNAIQVIRWVKQYKDKQYKDTVTKKIFDAVSATIF
jgi:branched-chain amino acid aminotransferase